MTPPPELTAADLRRAHLPAPVIEAVTALTKLPNDDLPTYYARVRAHRLATLVKHADHRDNTDPHRRDQLDPATRTRLNAKYAHAKQLLGDLPSARGGQASPS